MAPGRRGLMWSWQDRDWQSVGLKGQAVRALADPVAPHSHTDKPRGPDSEWQRGGQAEQWVAPHNERQGAKQTTPPRAPAQGNKASNL